MALPRSVDVLKDIATEYGVCVRPLAMRRTDLDTGQTEVIDLPCGATREDKCPPCAKRARRLRQAQIREGWHRDDEPLPRPGTGHRGTEGADPAAGALGVRPRRGRPRRPVGPGRRPRRGDRRGRRSHRRRGAARPGRTTRTPPTTRTRTTSTGRRRSGPPSGGRTRPTCPGEGRAGAPSAGPTPPRTAPTYQPSMWLTSPSTLRPGPRRDGTPVNPPATTTGAPPGTPSHFPRLLDRFWQNLRRCEGWNVQYAGCVEPQRRLAPHAHFAIRGTIPRDVLRTGRGGDLPPGVVAAASTSSVHRRPAARLGRRRRRHGSTRTPGEPLTTWAEALDAIDADPDAEPVHVVRFGAQVDAQGVMPGTEDAERTIRYVTKYITKYAGDCHSRPTDRQRGAPRPALARTPASRPCSDRCANWLLYGVQPKKAHAEAQAGPLQGQGPPARHPRHRRPAHPRLPRLVRQDPRRPQARRPRLGPGAARRHHRRRPATAATPTPRVGTRPARRPATAHPAATAPARDLATHPVDGRNSTPQTRPAGSQPPRLSATGTSRRRSGNDGPVSIDRLWSAEDVSDFLACRSRRCTSGAPPDRPAGVPGGSAPALRPGRRAGLAREQAA